MLFLNRRTLILIPTRRYKIELVRMEAVFENENFLLFVKQSNYRQSNE